MVEYGCPECGKKFSSEELLQEHARLEHSGPVEPILEEGIDLGNYLETLKGNINRSFAAGLLIGLMVAGITFSGFMYWQSLDHRVEVPVTVVTCENCSYGEFRTATEKLFNARYEEVNYQSERGQELIDRYRVNYVPAFIIDRKLEKAESFQQVKPALMEFEEAYVIPDSGAKTAQRLSNGKELD